MPLSTRTYAIPFLGVNTLVGALKKSLTTLMSIKTISGPLRLQAVFMRLC